MRYKIDFIGRKVGAIGIFERFTQMVLRGGRAQCLET